MPQHATSYPLPSADLLAIPPDTLAASALASVQRIYGITLDFSLESLHRADVLCREHLRIGHYRQADFPAALALTLSAYVGEVLRRHVTGGHWGHRDEEVYGTPLPFLVFSVEEHERQINVVEEMMAFLWSGKGLPPHAYVQAQLDGLRQLGFTVTA